MKVLYRHLPFCSASCHRSNRIRHSPFRDGEAGGGDCGCPSTPNLKSGGPSTPNFMQEKICARRYSKICRHVFRKKNQQGCISEDLADQTAYTINLHTPIPSSATPMLPSINRNALRFIPSSYWTIRRATKIETEVFA